jgi:hypothetical protein
MKSPFEIQLYNLNQSDLEVDPEEIFPFLSHPSILDCNAFDAVVDSNFELEFDHSLHPNNHPF